MATIGYRFLLGWVNGRIHPTTIQVGVFHVERAMTATTLVFVGCLNQAVPHFAAANGKGISVFAFDETTGALSWLADTVDAPNPTYLAVLAERGMLYATSEVLAGGRD
jgi:hypothetical protein